MNKTTHLIYDATLVSMALTLSYIELFLPPLPFLFPGAKLGLSNIIILITLVILGFKDAFVVSIFKSILLLMVTGQVIPFFYSVAGALASVAIMGLLYKYCSKYISLIGISVMGSIAHNFAQIFIASIMFSNIKLLYYTPALLVVGILTGIFVGITAMNLEKPFKKILKIKVR